MSIRAVRRGPAPKEPEGPDESLKLAYDFVRPSYEMAEKRLSAIEGRIQNQLAFAGTLALGTPVFARAIIPAIQPDPRFALAMVAFGFAVTIGLYARWRGELTILSPKTIREDWLDLDPDDFRRYLLEYAGAHYERNRRLVNWKARCTDLMAILFVAQVGLSIWWLISPPIPA